MRLRHLVVSTVPGALGVAPAAAQWINHPTIVEGDIPVMRK